MLTPRRPYLLRAMYEWLLDNDLTPHVLVDVTRYGVEVPMEFAQDNKIVLNIAPHAVGNLEMTNEVLRFSARFSGVPRQIIVPMAALLAIYAREDGQGMGFELEPQYATDPAPAAEASPQAASTAPNKPKFNIVK